MIEISDLKGFDFSKKYTNPAKEYIEITDEYEFKCSPYFRNKKINGTSYEFQTEFYTSKVSWTSEIFPFNIIRNNLKKKKEKLNEINFLKNLFPNDNFDEYELYDVLQRKKRRFYIRWAILINNGINIEEKTVAKKIIGINNEYYDDISFEVRSNFIKDLFHLDMKEDIKFNNFKNLSKNTILKYYEKNRESSADKQLLDEIFNNQEILEEKLSEFEEYKKFVYNKLDELRKELSKYINLDSVDLSILYENITFHKCSDEDEQMANRLILKEFGIKDYDYINELHKIHRLKKKIYLNAIKYQNIDKLEEFDNEFILTNKETFDFDTIKYQNIDEINNKDFKLAYIYYLQKINSYHNNINDSLHYFDDDGLTPKIYGLPTGFRGEDDFQQIPVQYLKEYGTIQKHITDGKGIGVLKFKTKLKEMKKVLEKYNLSKSGTKAKLIERILNNLSVKEINNEFPGHRFILTPDGEKILKNYKRYQKCFSYIPMVPANFTGKEFIKICELNPQYDIEDIIFSIVLNNWIIIEDENLFSKKVIEHIHFECYFPKMALLEKLSKNFPNKAEILLFNAITINSFISFYYIKRLCNGYHKQKKYEAELNFINLIYNKEKKGLIQINNFDSNTSEWLDKRKNTLYKNLNIEY